MTSNRTVKFEFQVEADDRQLGRFRDALGKINSATAVSESVLSGLRKELVALSQTTVQTENGLQAQIAALRDASRNADLTKSEYTSLRLEVSKLEKEYKLLTTNIVGLDKTYKVATQSARQFSQEQIAAAQRTNNFYLNNSGQRSADAANRAQFLAGTSGAANIFPVDPTSQLGFQQRIANLRQEATLVGMGTDAYKERALAINKLEQEYEQLARVEDQSTIDRRSRASRRQRIREIGNVASNVAIGGFFGGPEGLAGSAAGALAGSFFGPGGMVAGAQLGASVGLAAQQARIQATAVADMVAQLNLAKTALAQVSANQADYNQKLEFSRQVSTDYSVGLQATIEGYSKVTAAAAANGLTLKETETIYKGLLASGVAFGASQDDLQSIITATTQILSKGKLSAEEVSGQLGERIPGAVAKLAQVTGRSLKQLADDFQNGKVNIADFVKFAEGQLNNYDKAAKLIGSSPEKAGERLNLALTRMAESYGGFFQSVGAGFQDFATRFINWINSQSQGIKTMVGLLNWAGREVYKFQTNTPAVRAFQSLGSQLSGSHQARPPAGFVRNPADPYGISTTPFIQAPVFGRAPKAPKSNFFADRLREGERLFPDLKSTLFNQSTSTPALGDLTAADDKASKAADTAARKAQAEADRATQLQEKLDSEQRRRDELLANNAIRLADQVFQHRMDLLRQEYDLKQQLVEATRSAEEAGMTGVARNMQGTINQILSLYDRLKQGRLNDALDLKLADQRITTERKSAENTARYREVPQSAVGMRGGSAFSGGATTRWIRDKDAEQSGYDVVLPGGVGGRVPNPVSGLKVTGKGFQGSGRGATGRGYGSYVSGEFVGIDGKRYEMLLGHFDKIEVEVGDILSKGQTIGRQGETGRTFGTHVTSHVNALDGGDAWNALRRDVVQPWVSGWGGTKATPGSTQARTQPGAAQGINRNIVDTGNTDIATADKAALVAKQKQNAQYLLQTAEKQAEALIENTTTSYRDQTQALQDQLQEFRERNRLQMEGVKPEIIDQQMQLSKLTRDYARESEALSSALKGIGERNKDNASLFDTFTGGLGKLKAAYDENRQALEALSKAQNDERNIFSFDKSAKAGIDGYIESIGTLNNATSNLVQSGFNGISTALKELQSTGSTDFRKFALSLISDMQDIITQQFIVANLAKLLRGLFGGGGFSFSGASPVGFPGGGGVDFAGAMNMPALAFANGGVMTSNGPLKLQTYARGGIADRPQLAFFGEGSKPEAFVPLPDGRRIPVALSYPAIPGTPGGSGGDGAESGPGGATSNRFERTDTIINNAGKFERTDSMVTRMIESARQESADNATAAAIAASGGGVVKVQVESTVVNSIETVTMDQVQRVADAASARSTARHDAAMRNNPAERRRRGF
jgi:lambda family phage tail tape measure protein